MNSMGFPCSYSPSKKLDLSAILHLSKGSSRQSQNKVVNYLLMKWFITAKAKITVTFVIVGLTDSHLCRGSPPPSGYLNDFPGFDGVVPEYSDVMSALLSKPSTGGLFTPGKRMTLARPNTAGVTPSSPTNYGDQYPRPNIEMLCCSLKDGLIQINFHKVCKATMVCSDIGLKYCCFHRYHQLENIMSMVAKYSLKAVIIPRWDGFKLFASRFNRNRFPNKFSMIIS